MKVVICDEHGGFGLSKKAFERFLEAGYPEALKEKEWKDAELEKDPKSQRWISRSYLRDIPRNDPLLIKVVEEIGQEAAGESAHLKVVEIPDGVEWVVEEYDGAEWVAEKHRTWQ